MKIRLDHLMRLINEALVTLKFIFPLHLLIPFPIENILSIRFVYPVIHFLFPKCLRRDFSNEFHIVEKPKIERICTALVNVHVNTYMNGPE